MPDLSTGPPTAAEIIEETKATIVKLRQAASAVRSQIASTRVTIAQSREHIADANTAVQAMTTEPGAADDG